MILFGSGDPEGSPFPWIVSDFGLVDAIESGIVKIPRLPVMDTTGRPDPKYFKLWKAINDNLEPGERLPGKSKRPKPEIVYREAEGALLQIASQWKERFEQMDAATPGQERQGALGFDAFFSAPAGSGDAAAIGDVSPAGSTSAPPPAELEQFQDWLQQLRKP